MTITELNAFIAANYVTIVVSFFAFFAFAEMIAPLTEARERLAFRWANNLAVMAMIILLFKLIGPLLAFFSASAAEHLDFGLFNQVDLPLMVILLLSILLLDLKQYLFHRAMHRYQVLWQIHRVHHSDLEIDLTSGFRFHPFEVLLSALLDVIVVVLFGIQPEVILIHHMLTYLMNFFSHSNLGLPGSVERGLKRVLVTPTVHHLHHALDMRAANCNFGVIFSIWDRLFGTFLDRHPEASGDQVDYRYGIAEYRDGKELNLWRLMSMPFLRSVEMDSK